MEKPRKKEWYYPELSKPNETEKRYIQGRIDSWNSCHDAMSAWIEGELSVENVRKMLIQCRSIFKNPNHYSLPEQELIFNDDVNKLHVLLTQRLGGK